MLRPMLRSVPRVLHARVRIVCTDASRSRQRKLRLFRVSR